MLDTISRYVVEALDRTLGGDWFQVGEAAPGDRKVEIRLFIIYFKKFLLQRKIEPLEHKHRYRFRVRAINKIGRSEPCEMLGDDILIKDPWGEWLIFTTASDYLLEVGTSLCVETYHYPIIIF